MSLPSSPSPELPSKVIVAVGTYEGVLAGWEISLMNKKKKFQIVFATPVHSGSVRSITVASPSPGEHNHHEKQHHEKQPTGMPGSFLSTGYDEMLKSHDFTKKLTTTGEVRTMSDFGTPACACFAPPYMIGGGAQPPTGSTHCLVGFAGNADGSGKIVLYKKRDWSVVHVLAGHEGGVSTMSVHPTGKLCLTAGVSDGKFKLWDLTKGRLAFVTRVSNAAAAAISTTTKTDKINPSVTSILWNNNGDAYAFSYGNHVTVRDVATGKDLLDVELPSRVNQICLLQVPEGLFVAAACNDGSLPVLAVSSVSDVEDAERERRAIMAIEPVEGPIAGEERFKCIASVGGYLVVTANSAGVVSLLNLQGAINMILNPDDDDDDDDDSNASNGESRSDQEDSDRDENDDDDDKKKKKNKDDGDESVELAVDFIDSVQLGTGARITCLGAAAIFGLAEKEQDTNADTMEGDGMEEEIDMVELGGNSSNDDDDSNSNDSNVDKRKNDKNALKRKREVMSVTDEKVIEKARQLVSEAKKIQQRKEQKRKKTGKKAKRSVD